VIDGVVGHDAVRDQVIAHHIHDVVDVAPLKRRERAADDFDVLLRHRPRSISRTSSTN